MILIENEIAFVSVPKCASISVHKALENSDVIIHPTFYINRVNENRNGPFTMPKPIKESAIQAYKNYRINRHIHQPISEIYSYLKYKSDTLIIKRDYCKRFISAFHYLFIFWIKDVYDLKYKPNSIDNDFIYKYFTDEVCELIKKNVQNLDENELETDLRLKKLLIEPLILNHTLNYNAQKIIEEKLYDNTYINYKILDSQESWRSGYAATYTFNIEELKNLEKFILEKYGKVITINKENSLQHDGSWINLVENQKLRDWVWNKFEKGYFKKTLI